MMRTIPITVITAIRNIQIIFSHDFNGTFFLKAHLHIDQIIDRYKYKERGPTSYCPVGTARHPIHNKQSPRRA
jgi:hypothetical protein